MRQAKTRQAPGFAQAAGGARPENASRRRIIVSAAMLIGLLAGGCSLFRGPSEADVSYQQARREINGPQEDYRAGVRQASHEEPAAAAEEESGFQLSDLSPTKVKEQIKTLAGKGRDPQAAGRLFDQGDRIYQQAVQAQGEQRRELLLEAAGYFERAAERHPDSTLEHDALFRLGECYFFADRYVEANETFETVLAKYKNSRYLDTIDVRRFALAQYWLQWHRQRGEPFYAVNVADEKRPWRDTKGHALRLFDRIRLDDPTGKLADDATMAAANAYFLAGDFMKAAMFYDDLRRTYPSSEHQFKAHLLGMQAKLQSYQGHDYSVTPLEEAEKLIEQMRKQFPQETAEHREEIDRAHGLVRKLQAERRWRMAEYYERRWEYGSARYYYQLIREDFGGTPLAAEAEKRLAALADKPARPPQHFQWLVDLFNAGQDDLDIPARQSGKRKAESGSLR